MRSVILSLEGLARSFLPRERESFRDNLTVSTG